jgi:hypothetical protein
VGAHRIDQDQLDTSATIAFWFSEKLQRAMYEKSRRSVSRGSLRHE